MEGEFAKGTFLWWWYDGFLAAIVLVPAAFLTFRATISLSWTSRNALIAKLLAILGTLMVLLLVLDRMNIETLSMSADAYGILSVAGAATAIVLGGIGMIATRGKRPKRRKGRDVSDIPKEAPSDEGGIPGATQVLASVRGAAAWLVVRSGSEPGGIIELTGSTMTIGGDPESQIHLDDPSVSASHALIRGKLGSYSLVDLGSRTGTLVNGQLEAGVILQDGSRISIGSSELFYTQVAGSGEQADDTPTAKDGVLLVRSGPSMGQSFQVPQGDLVIGRQPGEGGARIDDPAVSQRHALLRQMPRGARLYDLGSANGTKVDDEELTGAMLKNGDILKFGDAEVQFVHEESD